MSFARALSLRRIPNPLSGGAGVANLGAYIQGPATGPPENDKSWNQVDHVVSDGYPGGPSITGALIMSLPAGMRFTDLNGTARESGERGRMQSRIVYPCVALSISTKLYFSVRPACPVRQWTNASQSRWQSRHGC